MMAPNGITRRGRVAAGLVVGIALGVAPVGDVRAQSACGQLGVDCSFHPSSHAPSSKHATPAGAARREQPASPARFATSSSERELALRHANEAGIAAFKSRKWDLAIDYFQHALLLEPSNKLVLENLRNAQEQQAIELRNAREQQAIERARRERDAEQLQLAHFTSRLVAISLPHDVAASVPVPADPRAWTQLAPRVDLTQKLATARSAYRATVPLAKDFVREAIWKVPLEATAEALGPPAPRLLEHAYDVAGAREFGRQYRELVENVTAETFGAAHETVAILGGAGGSVEHVLDTPERVRAMVGQFVSDQLFEEMWSRVKAWGRGYLSAPVADALRDTVLPSASATK